MNNRKNFISALLYQCVHIVYGLVVPRVILVHFGSEINGLVSSITQFLSFISLLEGGLGAVVLAELYLPIENDDHLTIKRILTSSQLLFNKISVFYIAYTIILGFIYAFSVKGIYDFSFIFTLTLILSLTTLAEYLFSITYRLLLQANQKIYITNYISSGVLLTNIVVTFISISIFPEIRLLKIFSAIAFFIQPIILRRFIPFNFRKINTKKFKIYKLKNRWSGFSQNLAHFINMNTDIILITFFCNYSEVSVYSVYMIAINALRMIMSTIADSYQGAIGKYIAQRDECVLQHSFYRFSIGISGASVALFSTCLLLINPFVEIYTANVYDVDYFRPVFVMVMLIANLIYCIREPFRLLILAAGKFKETNFGAILEAILNVLVSVMLIKCFGLTGVAIGTLVAILYRMIYFIVYLRKNVLMLDIKRYIFSIFPSIVVFILNLVAYKYTAFNIDSIMLFFMYGVIILICEFGVIFMFGYIVNKLLNRIS